MCWKRPERVRLADRVLLEDAAVVDVERGLRAVGELELTEDVRDVRLHGPLADPERRRDLLVRPTACHELQDLPLACGEVAVALVVPGRAVAGAQPTELVEHPLRDRGVDEREPVGHGSDRVGELAAGDLLQEVARRPGADRAEDELVLVVVREHDHARRRYGAANAPRCSVSSTVSVHPGGVPSTASRYGMVARTIVPRPGSLRTTSCPPTPSARSRMPTMP